MSGSVGLVVAPEARRYDHGPQHPLRPERVLLTWELLAATGLDAAPGVTVLGAEPADDATIGLVHTPAFIDATRRAGHGEDGDWRRFGYGPGDNPIFADMHEAGCARVRRHGRGRARGRRGPRRARVQRRRRPPPRDGRQAPPGSACTTTPPSASRGCSATAWIGSRTSTSTCTTATACRPLRRRPSRAHGLDPRVRARGRLLPRHRVGVRARAGAGEGSVLNVPLAPGTGDDAWLAAFRGAVLPASATSGPTSSSRSSDATRTTRTRSRTCGSPRAPTARPRPSCTGSRTRLPPAGGWRPAAAATSGRASCRARGRRTSRRWRTAPVPDELPAAWVERASALAGRRCRRRSASRPRNGRRIDGQGIDDAGSTSRSAGRTVTRPKGGPRGHASRPASAARLQPAPSRGAGPRRRHRARPSCARCRRCPGALGPIRRLCTPSGSASVVNPAGRRPPARRPRDRSRAAAPLGSCRARRRARTRPTRPRRRRSPRRRSPR